LQASKPQQQEEHRQAVSIATQGPPCGNWPYAC
jgi:hypothetical protein